MGVSSGKARASGIVSVKEDGVESIVLEEESSG